MTTSPSSDPLKDTHNALLVLHTEIRRDAEYQAFVIRVATLQTKVGELQREIDATNVDRLAFVESKYGARLAAANEAFTAAGGMPTTFPLRE